MFSYGVTSRIVCTCLLCHVIYHNCDKGSWRQSLLSTAKCCNACRRNLIKGLTSAASPRVHVSSTCKVGQKLGLSLPLLTCFPSAWPSRLLYSRGRKPRRDLLITLYIYIFIFIEWEIETEMEVRNTFEKTVWSTLIVDNLAWKDNLFIINQELILDCDSSPCMIKWS